MSEGLARKAGGAVFWQVVQLVGCRLISLTRTLVLAILLVPEDFGLLAIASVAINMLMSMTEFGMVQALIQKTDTTPRDYHTAWTVKVGRALFVTTAIVGTAPWIATAFAVPESVGVIRALAFRPLLEGLQSIRLVDLTRGLHFKPRAMKSLAAALIEATVSIGLAHWIGVWALVVGSLIGAAADTLISYAIAPFRPKLVFESKTAASLFRFGRWIFLTTVLAVAGGAALRMIVSRMLGPAELGLFYLAASIALLPNDTLSQVVGEVAFPVHSRIKNDVAQTARVFRASLVSLFAILLPVYAIMIALAPSMVSNILPKEWLGTERIIQVIAIAGIIGAMFDAASPMFEGRGRPQRVTLLFAVHTVCILAFAPFLTARGGLIGAALALLAAEAIVQLLAAASARRAAPGLFAGLRPRLLTIAFSSLMGALTGLALDAMIPSVLGFGVAVVCATAVAAGLLWYLDRRLNLGLATDLLRLFPELTQLLPALFRSNVLERPR